MQENKEEFFKSYNTKEGKIRYMFCIDGDLDPETNTIKRTTHRGFKSVDEAKDAYSKLILKRLSKWTKIF